MDEASLVADTSMSKPMERKGISLLMVSDVFKHWFWFPELYVSEYFRTISHQGECTNLSSL